ncbi:MAG TPA: DUF305 domain-containing protein [Longimicrobiaceae bacterium]|nr:DUF305 domain-containing protein [Longimicrobiaceae bacterium]
MKERFRGMGLAGLLVVLVLAACGTASREPGPQVVRPGAPGEPARAAAPEARPDTAQRRYTEADVRFMQRMLLHHAQAMAMTRLAPTRTNREEMRLLAERIEVSQQDEMARMRRWLEARGEEVPSLDAQHAHHGVGGHHEPMPGMLTEEELARLAAARGAEFDRLFLEFMIRHHEGALVMVEELFAAEGAGREPELFQLASHVDADQRAEIARMRRMQDALLQRGSE